MKPLAVDLCCGLGGWTEGLLAEGWDVVGFDLERHVYGESRYPAQLVLQDIRTLDGRQFLGKVSLVVASPPCQRFSYMAMPWKRAKALIPWYRDPAHPERLMELTELVMACFRIAREAECPIVLENVKGAQPWIGRAKWLYGSFALWGDVPALMPITKLAKVGGFTWSDYGKPDYVPHGFNRTAEQRVKATKNDGGSWFAVAHNTTSGKANNARDVRAAGIKHGGDCFSDPTWAGKQGGTKQPGIGGLRTNGKGDRWFQDGAAQHGSKSNARKAASAHMAKIPLVLARHVARAWWPA